LNYLFETLVNIYYHSSRSDAMITWDITVTITDTITGEIATSQLRSPLSSVAMIAQQYARNLPKTSRITVERRSGITVKDGSLLPAQPAQPANAVFGPMLSQDAAMLKPIKAISPESEEENSITLLGQRIS
jgi:hypothetical protein